MCLYKFVVYEQKSTIKSNYLFSFVFCTGWRIFTLFRLAINIYRLISSTTWNMGFYSGRNKEMIMIILSIPIFTKIYNRFEIHPPHHRQLATSSNKKPQKSSRNFLPCIHFKPDLRHGWFSSNGLEKARPNRTWRRRVQQKSPVQLLWQGGDWKHSPPNAPNR